MLGPGGEPTIADSTFAQVDAGQVVDQVPAARRRNAVSERTRPGDESAAELVSLEPAGTLEAGLRPQPGADGSFVTPRLIGRRLA